MKGKSDLETYIKSQRLMLDSEHPSEGHEERFLQRLYAEPVRKIRFRHALQVAASVAVILASSMLLIYRDRSGSRTAGAEIPQGILNAQVYYSAEMDARYEHIREFRFENEEEKAVLMDELDDLDTYHRQLMDDLETHPADERLINALIRHYQVKLEIMDQIIDQLEQIRTEINSDHVHKSL